VAISETLGAEVGRGGYGHGRGNVVD